MKLSVAVLGAGGKMGFRVTKKLVDAGHDVRAQPFRGERRQHRGVGVGLDRERDQRIAERGQRGGERARLVPHRGGRVDVDGRPHGRRDFRERDLLAMHRAAAQRKGFGHCADIG